MVSTASRAWHGGARHCPLDWHLNVDLHTAGATKETIRDSQLGHGIRPRRARRTINRICCKAGANCPCKASPCRSRLCAATASSTINSQIRIGMSRVIDNARSLQFKHDLEIAPGLQVRAAVHVCTFSRSCFSRTAVQSQQPPGTAVQAWLAISPRLVPAPAEGTMKQKIGLQSGGPRRGIPEITWLPDVEMAKLPGVPHDFAESSRDCCVQDSTVGTIGRNCLPNSNVPAPDRVPRRIPGPRLTAPVR